ncbi:MAG: hypothetical protein QM687_06325 [Ferruginibacter sp.]
MGVITTAYSVPFERFSKVKRYKKNLDYVLGLRTAKDNSWKFEAYDFDKTISGLFEILKGCGYEHAGNMLDVENFYYKKNGRYFNHEGYGMWYANTTDVGIMVKELKKATFENLKKDGLAAAVTDYYGKPIPAHEYEYYVGNIAKWKAFLNEAFEKGNYLVFAEA